MLRTTIVCVTLMILLNGCAAYRNNNLERLQTLPHQYSQFDAKLAWQVTSDGTSTVIDGIIKNIRYYEMDELELWVFSLDAKGREVHRASDFVYRLKENEAGQFTLKIPQVASRTRLRFLYRYIGNDGGGESGSSTRWSQSFESEVP